PAVVLEEAVVPSGGLGHRGGMRIGDPYDLRATVAPKALEQEEELPGQGLFQRVVRSAEHGDHESPPVQRPCIKGDGMALAIAQQLAAPYDRVSVQGPQAFGEGRTVVATR